MKYIFTLAILLQSFFALAQTTIYVNQNVQGGQQTGNSWANAYPDLQLALSTATDGDEIWVAKGVYFPTAGVDRFISFVLKQGVKLYGGFDGTENVLTERNFETNQTILSGNIGGPQGSDNSYHVLYGIGLDSTTVVDGFTISRGMANGNNPSVTTEWGGGLLLEPSPDLYNTCPIIQNCTFEENYALIGGAVHCAWEIGNYFVNPIVRNCRFVSNRAQKSGGAVYKSGPSVPDLPFSLFNCTFSKNSVYLANGGALHLTNIENTTEIIKCIFEMDSSKFFWGGAVFCDRMRESQLVLKSCEFIENYAVEGGAMFTDYDLSVNTLFSLNAMKCTFEKNKAYNGFGGAILLNVIGNSESKQSARFSNCNFVDNRSKSYGTAMLIGGREITFELDRCIFLHNVGVNPNPNGAKYAVMMGGLKTESKISNCLFAKNESVFGFFPPEDAIVKHLITNCTFYQNGKYVFDKTVVPFGVPGSVECYITNSIFDDDATFDRMFSDNSPTSTSMDGYHIDYSFVSLDDNVTPNEAFGEHTVFKATPFFVDTANNDFRLQKCSPAVNAGNNLIVDTLGLLTDLDGNPRIRFDTVDIGAFEVQDSCFTINSAEPESAAQVVVALSPNPIGPGEFLTVRTPGLEPAKMQWALRDALGRVVTSGSVIADDSQGFTLMAPQATGIYFLEMYAGGKIGRAKLVVQ